MEIIDLIEYIPGESYEEWIQVGMALHHEGYDCSVWDEWSSRRPKYIPGQCDRKWATFDDDGSIVTGGTIYHLACEHGFAPIQKVEGGHAIGWDDNTIAKVIPDLEYLPHDDIPRLYKSWDPIREITTFLKTAFDEDDIVGIVNDVYESKSGSRGGPKAGSYSTSVREYLDRLDEYKGKEDVLSLAGLGKNRSCGAWCRINPLDGKGIKDTNVTSFRHVLVESDTLSLKDQYAVLKELQLPITTLTYSGGKSLHALVKVEASSARQYRDRVNFIFEVCKKNGFEIDRNNKNPSRLSRLPGYTRGEQQQYLVALDRGCETYSEWEEYIKSVMDDLPDVVSFADMVRQGLPPLKEEFIEGVARVGSKILFSGPPKAGKSMLLIHLAVCVAERLPFFGRRAAHGPVCLINFEVDEAEYFDRIDKVYKALGVEGTPSGNLDVWNLRGKEAQLDKIAGSIIRRLKKRDGGYKAVILDPLYKTLTGDENSASEMARFCGLLDRICAELDTTLVYAHHFSKGAQGGKKSIDRSSGSGVFGRDPDAVMTLTELPISKKDKDFKCNQIECCAIRSEISLTGDYDIKDLPDEDVWDAQKLWEILQECRHYSDQQASELSIYIERETQIIRQRSAYRLEMTLRSFATPEPIDLYYEYPLHRIDTKGELSEKEPESVFGAQESRNKGNDTKKKVVEDGKEKMIEIVKDDPGVRIKDLAEELNRSEKTIKRWISETDELDYAGGKAFPAKNDE